ncbi:MAG: hypothetical protein V8T36_11020 [Ruthenibacterium lactatiformans]
MLLGFVSYGLSINFYIMAQKNLGAAKTSPCCCTVSGVGFSFIILGERTHISILHCSWNYDNQYIAYDKGYAWQ